MHGNVPPHYESSAERPVHSSEFSSLRGMRFSEPTEPTKPTTHALGPKREWEAPKSRILNLATSTSTTTNSTSWYLRRPRHGFKYAIRIYLFRLGLAN